MIKINVLVSVFLLKFHTGFCPANVNVWILLSDCQMFLSSIITYCYESKMVVAYFEILDDDRIVDDSASGCGIYRRLVVFYA